MACRDRPLADRGPLSWSALGAGRPAIRAREFHHLDDRAGSPRIARPARARRPRPSTGRRRRRPRRGPFAHSIGGLVEKAIAKDNRETTFPEGWRSLPYGRTRTTPTTSSTSRPSSPSSPPRRWSSRKRSPLLTGRRASPRWSPRSWRSWRAPRVGTVERRSSSSPWRPHRGASSSKVACLPRASLRGCRGRRFVASGFAPCIAQGLPRERGAPFSAFVTRERGGPARRWGFGGGRDKAGGRRYLPSAGVGRRTSSAAPLSPQEGTREKHVATCRL